MTYLPVPVFPAVIDNRGVSHPSVSLREGWRGGGGRFLLKWRQATCMYKTVTREAIGCNRYFPSAVTMEFIPEGATGSVAGHVPSLSWDCFYP